MNELKIEYIPLSQIREYGKNAKLHPDKQLQQLAISYKRFGFNNPILIDEVDEIIAGHGRKAAAELAGMDVVPVIRLSHLSEAQKRAYRLADNKISEMGGWDTEMLKLELAEIEVICEDFDITDTGFDTLEIDSMSAPEKADKEKVDEKANAVPFVPDDEIVTDRGDIWQIGKHRIICGDSLSEETYQKLMDGALADQVLTDPPYNVSSASIGNSGKIKHDDFAMAAGEMSEAEFIKFLTDVMTHCSKYSTATALGYYWMDWRHSWEILSAGRAVYPLFVNQCVWSKASGGMGKLYRSQHEMCFIFGKDKKYLDNVELGKHGRYRTNVWNYAGVNSFGAHKGDQKFHPTVKPMEMFKDAMLDCTPRGGNILDVFLGSGTTLIAAEKAKRICYGIEFEPKYVDTTIRRYKDLFGVGAVRFADGKTYSELLEALQVKNS